MFSRCSIRETWLFTVLISTDKRSAISALDSPSATRRAMRLCCGVILRGSGTSRGSGISRGSKGSGVSKASGVSVGSGVAEVSRAAGEPEGSHSGGADCSYRLSIRRSSITLSIRH